MEGCPYHNNDSKYLEAKITPDYFGIEDLHVTLEVDPKDKKAVAAVLEACNLEFGISEVNTRKSVQISPSTHINSIDNRIPELKYSVKPLEEFLVEKKKTFFIPEKQEEESFNSYIERVFEQFFRDFNRNITDDQLKILNSHTFNRTPQRILVENRKLVPSIFQNLLVPYYRSFFRGISYSLYRQNQTVDLMKTDKQMIKDFLWHDLSKGYNGFLADLIEHEVPTTGVIVCKDSSGKLILDPDLVKYRSEEIDFKNKYKLENKVKLERALHELNQRCIKFNLHQAQHAIHKTGKQGHCPVTDRRVYDALVDLWFEAATKFLPEFLED